MSENVVNLRSFRKAKARAEAEIRAEENRAKFGQTKAQKTLREAEESLERRRLEAGKLEKPSGEQE